ncbi:hypothetical protein [Micrococcus luteus]|uniref:hypothetical protein n=1 Tax=Micrococcus luteus TaxID=1270 RepID=UPI003D338DCE
MSGLDYLAAAWRLTLSGVTRAEVMGLRWEGVDLNAGTVTVAQGRVQSISKGGEIYVGDPKSAQRVRAVHVEAIHPGTVDLLQALKARQARHQLKAGAAWHSTGYVVVDELGRPVRPDWYSDRFRALFSKAGVPTIRLHAVRHSLAHLFHPSGVTPPDAAGLWGHLVEARPTTYPPRPGGTIMRRADQAAGPSCRTRTCCSRPELPARRGVAGRAATAPGTTKPEPCAAGLRLRRRGRASGI